MNSVVLEHVSAARSDWWSDHPFGFVARPTKNSQGNQNLMLWECMVPGKKGTSWAGGLYTLEMQFTDKYPSDPPKCKFNPPIFHPNVHPSGMVYFALLDKHRDWKYNTKVKEILRAIQELMSEPDMKHAANAEAYKVYKLNREQYENSAKQYAKSTGIGIIYTFSNSSSRDLDKFIDCLD